MSLDPQYTVIRKGELSSITSDIDQYPEGIVIPFDKPLRWTSADVVRKLKFKLQYYFHKKNLKVGHAGTLDPLASGMLIVCVGKATKISELLQAERKEYIADITFGATTPSFDLEKEIDATYPYEHITPDSISEVLTSFTGEQQQVPPLFSAKFVDGVRAYEMAREGSKVELKSSTINIYNLELIEYKAPTLRLRIECSKGTYIRALARDIGCSLGSGAYLSSLRRTRSGSFDVEEAVTMEETLSFFSNT
jgi:tRNA pseudouridine55 synthase